MKFKSIITLCMAGVSISAFAQTHVEGEEYYKADQLDNAKELLTRSLSNPGTDKAVSNYYLGMIAVEENKLPEAASYFSKGIQANPENAFNYVGEGLLKLMSGNEKEAEAMFKDADKKGKKDASLQVEIARAYDSVDPVKYQKQIAKAMEKARKYDINDPDIFLFEGDVAKRLIKGAPQEEIGRIVGDAAGKYEMAANADSNASAAYVKYANLYTTVNPDYAIRMLNNLLRVNPNSALGQRELANAYYNKKDYASAAKQYGKYVQNPSHFKKDEDRYAFLLFYGGDYKKGYDYATALLKQNPGNFTAQRYQFMNAAQIAEMKDSLLPMAESLYAAHKANPQANKFAPIDYTLIADELNTAGRSDEAIEVLKEAVKDQPDNGTFYKQLAFIYVDRNDITDAADTYEAYLANIEPGYNDFIQQATFDFYAGVENKPNPEKAAQYFDKAKSYADKAREILPDNYKPKKIYGDIAKQTADKANIEKAAAPMYEEAIVLLEASNDPSRYATDAKEMYNYMGNYYLDLKDVEKAKSYFLKYLQYDPDNAEYRKFVESLK
ncbi:MAG: tetratricopeptide repeat protein [Candidatus Amulumruptor caecigallinarius]|nr:tetratricopeptide repeat protein [Candidatus Amulumruptor caecigallinarius]